MINYYCNKYEIEKNAMDCVLDIENDMDEICVFSDIHYCSENSIPVGVAFSSVNKFFPLVTGKDVGCGVMFLRFSSNAWKKEFDKTLHYNALNKSSQDFTDDGLGGGNHFLSIEKGDDNYTYIICHTGTRNLGIYMYQHFLSLINNYNFKENMTGDSLPLEYWTDELQDKYSKIIDFGINRRKQFVTKTYDFLIQNNYINKTDYETIDSIHNIFTVDNNYAIHRKGATVLNRNTQIAIPLSMTRGTLIVQPKGYDLSGNLWSCSHGAGRKLSRTDSLKFWHSMKNKDKKLYKEKFSEMLDRNGNFLNGYLQEFDFAYKNSDNILEEQPFLKKISQTTPIVTIKYTEI
jgi:tRNA-splicing ligase RtcB/release factor H-coupled RctB family protein